MESVKEEKIKDSLNQIKLYSKIQLELFKLKTIEKSAVAGSYVFSRFLLLFVFAISVIFLSAAAAFYFSQLLGNVVFGFLLVGGFYLLLTLVVVLLKKHLLETPIKNKIISTLSDSNF